MADTTENDPMDMEEIEQETPPSNVFMPPSVHKSDVIAGRSYSHFSPIPQRIVENMATEVVLGVDEAGRGPVLGPMVYALFYLPIELHRSLLTETHHFDDSKVLNAEVRSNLMQKICTKGSDLYETSGWATRSLSAQDISAHMLSPAVYNLNAQAMDATIDLIKGVLAQGVNVKEIYIDTIGKPEVYQKKLERIWPTIQITVAKKADSLYPSVSAASVCAKVTRDASLEVCYEPYHGPDQEAHRGEDGAAVEATWGSGYSSDRRTRQWLKQNMDPLFGWGNECRFSWGTSKELLEGKNADVTVTWPAGENEGNDMRMTDFLEGKKEAGGDSLAAFFGQRITEEMAVF